MSKYFKNKLSLFLVLSLVVGLANFSPSHAGTVNIVANATVPGPVNILNGDTLNIFPGITYRITGALTNAGVVNNLGTLIVDTDFNSTISGQTYNFGNFTVTGNYTNTSSVFFYGGTVILNGLNQTITSFSSFGLYFNNLTVTGGTKTLNGSLILGGQLDLETIIKTTLTDTLGIDSAGSIIGLTGFTNHYIQGPIYRRGRDGSTLDPTGMVFPVADANGVYRPVVLYDMQRYTAGNDKPIIKVQAQPAVPPGYTYAGGALMPMSWDMELIGGKLAGGTTVELVYTPADIGATPPGTLAVLQAGTAGVYSSLGKLIANSQGIISVKKALLPLGSSTSMAVGVGCPAITASISVAPNDTICTGASATFSVTASALYDSVYYYVNGVLKLKDVANKTFTTTTLANKDTVTALISSGGGICVDTMAKKIIMTVLTVTVNAGLDQTICDGNTATLAGTISAGGGQWTSTGTGTFSPNNTTLTATYTPSAGDILVNNVTLTLKSTLCTTAPVPSDLMKVNIVVAPTVSVSNITSSGMKFSWPIVGGATGYSISINHGPPIPLGGATLFYNVTGQAPLTYDTAEVKATTASCQSPIGKANGRTLAAACDSSWTVAGAPFCIASLKSKLTPTVSGGVFTGPGVTFIAPDYYFDPGVSGAGTFSITYTPPCGKFLTKSIVVNDAPCVASITPVGSAAVPLISNPQGIASDCDGSVYFSDTDHNAIWRIDPFGNPSVLIGDTTGVTGDGTGAVPPASGVRLNKPEGLVAYNGDIYFADAFNNKIKKYTKSTGMVSLIAGTGGALDVPASPPGTTSTAATAQFKTPSAVTIDITGTILYVADRGNKAIKKIDMTTGTVTYIATTLSNPASIALYGNSLYFSMPSANSIGAVDLTTNTVSTYYKLVIQPALAEQPYGLSIDCMGRVYYTDAANGEVRVVTSSTTSTSLVPGLNNPTALSVYNKGFIDIANSGSNQILRYAISNWKTGAFNGLDTTHCVYDAADVLNPLTCNIAGGFSFSGNGIQLVAGTYKFNPAVAGVGRHKIVYKFNAGFCQDSLIEYANVYPRPVPNLGADQSVCANNFGLDSLHAGKNGTKPYNPYQWFRSTTTGAAGTYSSVGGNTEYFVPPLPAGSPVYYAVQVTDTNGCIGADTIQLTKLAVTAISIAGTDSICYGASSALSTQPGGFTSYSWNTGAVTSSISVTQSGDYIVNATGANGCIAADTFRVTVRSLPAVCITAPASYGYGVWNVSTIAGSTTNASGTTDNVKGTLARFNTPWDIYFNNGNLYVTEAQRVRKIRISDTLVTTFAGSLAGTVTDSIQRLSAKFVVPKGIVADNSGNFYVANRDYIAKIDIVKDSVYILAGSDLLPGYADGSGVNALFDDPKDIDIDAFGNIYVADYNNHSIRKITPQGIVSTNAGSGPPAGHVEGTGAAAKFNWPFGVAFDVSGNLLVVEEGGQIVRKINASRLTSTLAGAYSTSGFVSTTPWVAVAGSVARFSNPWDGVIDKSGRMFMTDALNNSIRMVDRNGNVTTIAGATGASGGVDGLGDIATFNVPNGITLDPSNGNLYVADRANHKIRKITQNKTIALCPGAASSVTVDASCSGNGNTYAWRKKGAVAILSAVASYTITSTGTYIVTVTDNKGCVNTDSVIVVPGALPLADAGADSTYCGPVKNKVLGTTAIAGNTYSWNTAPPTAVFSTLAQPTVALISSTTKYVVTVTNTATGCSNKDTVQKIINALPAFTLGNDTAMCAYGDSLLKGPSIAGASYVWTSSKPFQPGFVTTNSPVYLAPSAPVTDYYLTVTGSNTCVKKDTLRITLNPLPPANQGVYNPIYCRNSVINLGVAGNYGLYSYLWTTNNPPMNGGGYNNDTLSNPTFLLREDLGIQFVLTVTNRSTTCSTTVYGGVTVKPSPIAGFTYSGICFPTATSFTDTSTVVGLATDPITSWKWSFGDAAAVPAGSDTSGLQNPTYTFTNSGLYNVKMVVDNGSCKDSITQVVNINGLIVGYSAPTSVCSGNPVNYTNTSSSSPAGALVSTWDFGDGSPIVNTTSPVHTFPVAVGAPVPYSVKLKVTSVNGCADSVTKVLTVYPFPNAAITPPSPINACAGSTINLDVNASYNVAPYQVIWRNVSTNTIVGSATTLPVSTSGIYRATVTDTVGGCADSSAVTLNFLNLPAGLAIVAPASSCSNAPLKLVATVTAGDSLQFKWITTGGLGTFSTTTNDTTFYTPDPADASPLSFTISAYNRCDSISLNQNINLLTAPPGSFTYLPAEPFMNDLVTFTPGDTTGNNIQKWVWNFQEGNAIDSVNLISTHTFLHGGSFPVTLTLINNAGCPVVVTNPVNITGPSIYIPNVFVPTAADPENAVCKVYGKSISPTDFSFKIFDKWGAIVYQTVDFTQANQSGWNGKNMSAGDPLPMGVYTWAVKGQFFDGSTFEKAGTVTLMR